MHERSDIFLCIWSIDKLGGFKVEIRSVELEGPFEIRHTETKMAQLMDGSRTLFEPLCLVDLPILVRGEIVGQLWKGFCHFDRRLSIDQMPRSIVDWVIKRHSLSSTWRI